MTSTSWTPLPSLSFGWKYDRLEAHLLTLDVSSTLPKDSMSRHRGLLHRCPIRSVQGRWNTGELPYHCWYSDTEVSGHLGSERPLLIPFTDKADLKLLLPDDLVIYRTVRAIPISAGTKDSCFFLLMPFYAMPGLGGIDLELTHVDRDTLLVVDRDTLLVESFVIPFKAFLDRLEFDDPSLIQVLIP